MTHTTASNGSTAALPDPVSSHRRDFDAPAFHAALARAVDARGVKWIDVAAATGVSATTLSRMQSGRRPDAASLAALSAWAGLNPAEFLVRPEAAAAQPQGGPAAPSTAINHDLDDLTTLVRRLARNLRKVAPDAALANQAVDYLERKGFNATPFRDSSQSQPPTQGDGPAGVAQAVDDFQPCSSCFGTGVEGDADDYGRTIDVICGECDGSGRAGSLYKEKCPDGHRCLQGCHKTEGCYHVKKAAPAQPPAPAVGTENYVQPVPDHCDRITWRNQYYHLPIRSTTPEAAPTPPAREALTEQQIVLDGLMMVPNSAFKDSAAVFEAGVKFAERHHGITKENP